MNYFIYFIISLKNSKIYVGVTEKDPNIRLKEHNSGTNRFTRRNIPFKLVYFEKYECKKCAMAREKFYKTGVGKRVKYVIVKEFNI